MRDSNPKNPGQTRRARFRLRGGGPVRATIALLEQKWTLAIILALLQEKRRFTELADLTPGLNTRTLTERLRTLERLEIVERHEAENTRRGVEYSLTEKGRALRTVLRSIARWGRRWMDAPRPPERLPEAPSEALPSPT
jgi:DNA-binding HxlR family transcriptional regulator